MLPILTKYLLAHKQVVIPFVGRIELLQHAPVLDVAEKQVIPFRYEPRLTVDDTISSHQLAFLDLFRISEKSLSDFGRRFSDSVKNRGFRWRGIGSFSWQGHAMVMEPEMSSLAGWQPVPAQKVLRANVMHQHLVGDRELTSGQVTDMLQKKSERKRLDIIIGWSALAVLAGALIFVLARDRFAPQSSGLRTKAVPSFQLPGQK
ncbi:MAG TPA: hypothetical protein VFZ78_08225 [Flavisolibacter sp.]